MKKYLKISVITPSYNQGEFLEQTIKSVLRQNYPNLEYWVIDGGSTDNSTEILKKYSQQIKWLSEPDRGQAHAINKGLKKTTGDILAYLNSDDIYHFGTFNKINKFFLENPNESFVFGQGDLIDQSGKKIGKYKSAPANFKSLSHHCPISQPSAFWRRAVYEKVGEFDESYQFTMDYDYWIRVSKSYKLKYLKGSILSSTRIHSFAKTTTNLRDLQLDAIKTVKKHYQLVGPDWIRNYIDNLIVNKHQITKGGFLYKVIMKLLIYYYYFKWNLKKNIT